MVLHTAIFFILAVGAVLDAVTQTLLAHALYHVVVVHVLVHVRVRAQKLAQAGCKISRNKTKCYMYIQNQKPTRQRTNIDRTEVFRTE